MISETHAYVFTGIDEGKISWLGDQTSIYNDYLNSFGKRI